MLKSVGSNGRLIHPFDNVNVIAGQGTIGLEVLEQVWFFICSVLFSLVAEEDVTCK